MQKTFEGAVLLDRGDSELDPVGGGGYSAAPAEEKDPLSLIIEDLNRAFGGEGVNGDAPIAIQHLLGKLVESIAVQKSLEANPPDTARLTFDQVTDQLFAEMVDNYFEFYKKVTDNPQAKQQLFDWLFEQYRHTKTDT
jgi:type I restriction enzyme, R subunit